MYVQSFVLDGFFFIINNSFRISGNTMGMKPVQTPAHEQAIIQTVTRYLSPVMIYVFGSYGKPHFNAESDIDIAVLSSSPIDDITRMNLMVDLVAATSHEVDLVDLATAGEVTRVEALFKGTLLFCSDAAMREEFEYLSIARYGQYLDDISIITDAIRRRGHVCSR